MWAYFSRRIDQRFEVFPSICDYREKSMHSLVIEMKNAVNALVTDSEKNPEETIQKLVNIDADKKTQVVTQSFIDHFLSAKCSIEDMKKELLEAKRKIRSMSTQWKKRERAFKKRCFKLRRQLKQERKKNRNAI